MWFYQYGDDDVNDRGWGCVWRNLQTLLHHHRVFAVPTIHEIMARLGVRRSDRHRDMWIEPLQCKQYLARYHGIPARLVGLNVQPGRLLRTRMGDFDATTTDPATMDRWIRNSTLPCIIVDDAVSSYCIVGFDSDGDYVVADPHGTDRSLRTFRGRAWLAAQPMLMALV